jgi:hypothetical protein
MRPKPADRPLEPFQARPFVLASEETRWFAHCLFGRCGDAGPAASGDWRGDAPPPKKAA